MLAPTARPADGLNAYDKCIVKPMEFGGFNHENDGLGCFTSAISIADIEQFKDDVRYGPLLLQRRLEKHQELR